MLSKKEKELLTISGITPIMFEDEQFFNLAFPKDSIQYARSWLYVLRASHGDKGTIGYKYINDGFVTVIGLRNNRIYITPIADTTNKLKLMHLCKEISQKIKSRIFIKKYHHRTNVSCNSEKINKVRHFLEDDSFPETLIHLNKLFISKKADINPAAKRLTKKEKKFNPLKDQFELVDDITQIPLRQIEKYLSPRKEIKASYMPIINYLYSNGQDIRYKILVFLHQKEIHGLYIAETYSLTDAGLYCGVTSKATTGITEWMDIVFFRRLFLENIQTVYLGGAEREGIAQYINKLLPNKPTYFVQTLAYEDIFKKTSNIAIRSVTEDDFKTLAKLYAKVYNSMSLLDEHWSFEVAHKFISHFYKRQPDLFFLAEYDNKVVGAIVTGIQPWWDGIHLVEGEIFVDDAYRNRHIGKKLLKHLLLTARDKYKAIAWDTITPRTDYQLDWYQQMGFNVMPHWVAVSGDIHVILKTLV